MDVDLFFNQDDTLNNGCKVLMPDRQSEYMLFAF